LIIKLSISGSLGDRSSRAIASAILSAAMVSELRPDGFAFIAKLLLFVGHGHDKTRGGDP
jgi:hypothetical protein